MKLIAMPLIIALASSSASDDIMLKAMSDELARTSQLKLASAPAPFFACYLVHDTHQLSISASLGALTQRSEARNRYLVPRLRIGTAELDNTNFVHATDENGVAASLPIDDSYLALRRSIWLIADSAYKSCVQELEAKRAWLRQNKTGDRLADFRPEKPVVSVGQCPELAIDKNAAADKVVHLSTIFKNYPHIQKSSVELTARTVKRWLVNTEGTKIRDGFSECGLLISASGQASDGQKLVDSDILFAHDAQALLDDPSLASRVKELAERVEALCQAPTGEEYVGPVLFEGQGAASVISELLGPNLGFPVEKLGSSESSDWRNPFENGRGRKVMMPFLSLIDDPTMKFYKNQAVRGGYQYDFDGVPGQKLTLINHGILQMLCTSRTPTKWGEQSNGHSFCGIGWPSILILKSEKQMARAELKKRLIELGKEAGLQYVLVIRRLANGYNLDEVPEASAPNSGVDLNTPSSSRQLNDPIATYKVYLSDGHEELVRGLELRYSSMRTFRDIDCTGDDTIAYPVLSGSEPLKHVITPSLLVNEVELQPLKKEHEELPLLPSPLTHP